MPQSRPGKRNIKPVSFLWRDFDIRYVPVIGTVFPDGRVEVLFGLEDWVEGKSLSLNFSLQDFEPDEEE